MGKRYVDSHFMGEEANIANKYNKKVFCFNNN